MVLEIKKLMKGALESLQVSASKHIPDHSAGRETQVYCGISTVLRKQRSESREAGAAAICGTEWKGGSYAEK